MEVATATHQVAGSLAQVTKQAKISEDDLAKLWAMIEAPYKNSIGSIVREITSNCFDAHRAAKVDDAVRIQLSRDESGYFISFIDVGIGMTPEFIDEVYLNVLKSDKDKSNDFIGGFGIGSKSPLSYQSHFHIITRANGQEYHYIYRKGEQSPELDCLSTKPTKERNGTEIKINIKNESDLMSFANECFTQLYYFKNVVIDYQNLKNYLVDHRFNTIEEYFKDDYAVYEGVHFKARLGSKVYMNDGSYYNRNLLHATNGPVAYPLDNQFISDSSLQQLNIALKFEIGEVDVIRTREDLQYTEKTKLAIQSKISLVKAELEDLANPESIPQNLKEYLQSWIDYTKGTLTLSKNGFKETYTIKDFLKGDASKTLKTALPTLLPTMNQMADSTKVPINCVQFLLRNIGETNILNRLDSFTVRRQPSENGYSGPRKSVALDAGYYHSDDVLLTSYLNPNKDAKPILYSQKKDYDVRINKQVFFKDKVDYTTLKIYGDYRNSRTLKDYKYILKLKNNPKQHWRGLIKDFLALETEMLKQLKVDKQIVNYDTIKLDKTWWDKFRKANQSTSAVAKRDTTKISVTQKTDVWDVQNRSWAEVLGTKGLVIYTTKDDKHKLEWLHDINCNYRVPSKLGKPRTKHLTLHLLALAPRNYDKLKKVSEESPNFYTFDEFMENKDNIKFKVLSRLWLSNEIYLGFGEGDAHFTQELVQSNTIEALFPDISQKLSELSTLASQAGWDRNFDHTMRTKLKTELDELTDFMDENDLEVYNSFKRVKAFMYDFSFLFKADRYNNNNRLDVGDFARHYAHYNHTDTEYLPTPEILKHIQDEEYETLKTTYEESEPTDYTANEAIIAIARLNLYEVKKRIPLTKLKRTHG